MEWHLPPAAPWERKGTRVGLWPQGVGLIGVCVVRAGRNLRRNVKDHTSLSYLIYLLWCLTDALVGRTYGTPRGMRQFVPWQPCMCARARPVSVRIGHPAFGHRRTKNEVY